MAAVLLAIAIVQSSFQALIAMFCVVLLGLPLLGLGIFHFLRNRRLVLGVDSLMLIEGRENVIGNIPYDNMAVTRFTCSVPYADDAKIDQLEVLLHDRKRLDTFWVKPWIRDEDYDLRVTDFITVDCTYLRLLLVKAMRESGMDVGYVD